ncbi:DEAD/DEAH box helicase [Tenacibaculum finnmarkense genomovar ulcerans]|uniref:DEAD/DEAH box helicase n=1 Tax=Tenacibaculum finnmarkense TaxID=2781243 RepID=UPI001E3044FC|nr:DEAD/DEAH box helicase [Tenacibaculum finnmarkense]MCD8432552.1 DEAD/DEAH box helicase [Tenacibaculum finnmarkense genomovar ulcerans]
MSAEYIKKIQQLNAPTFQQIRKIANQNISHLSKTKRDLLWKKLNRGVDLLDTNELMCQYLFSYGNMHQAKIHDAISKLPKELFEKDFEIIDWGCGQGIGTICFFDYLKAQNIENNVVKATLIEPSKKALERASLHVNTYLDDISKIKIIPTFLDDITKEDIKQQENLPVIHFFSNILDIPQIDLKQLATKIDKSVIEDNYIVSVGPLNATNHRIDAFYNYFNVDVLYDKNESQYYYGNNSKCTYKAKIYKLDFNKEGNLIPIEFYPSVQFHSSYQLDGTNNEFHKNNHKEQLNLITNKLNVFETSAPFDIGASVYQDIHPILAVLNNIITRGLPTKASPFIENIFQKAFNFSEKSVKHGTFSFVNKKNSTLDYEKITLWYNAIISKKTALDYAEIDTNKLQLIYTPIAIARIQKTILEALITNKLDFKSKNWKILVEEKDVPCASIAFEDLSQIFNNLTKLSRDYSHLIFPEIELDIISNDTFIDSKLHLDKNVNKKIISKHLKTQYDLVIDIALFQTTNIEKKSFSKFQSKNNCYFNLRSVNDVKTERNIYTTDKIIYQNLVTINDKGVYSDKLEAKKNLEYFLQLIFRKEHFRPGQLPILNRALQNKSVIGLLPTGGGKSLTYQLAAMLQPGVTLIVDPLRSLMKDQYDGLITAGIDSCAYINSSLTKQEKDNAERKLEESKLLFIFLSPERLAIYKFREKLKNMHELNVYFSYGVIDEVHCVSEWGHDFRFSYLHLGRNLYNYVRSKDGIISLFGLTATASFDVLADVERELSGNGAFPLDSETIVRYENSNRLELQYKIEKVTIDFQNEYEVLKKSKYATPQNLAKFDFFIDNKLPIPIKISDKWGFFNAKKDFVKEYVKTIPQYINEIQTSKSIEYIKNSFEERQGNNEGVENDLQTTLSDDYYSKKSEYEQSGIIFCPHKANTGISVRENEKSLINIIPDIGTFSGGDETDNKSMENLELFRTNKQPLMVATKAFGMGIDKPNVRFTVNLNYSSSLESFVQEAGRGGRDRKTALSVIFLSDYKLARINPKYQNSYFPYILKGKWFKYDDLQKIIKHYKINIDEKHINYLTPENDLVRFFCKEGTKPKYYGFNTCSDTSCKMFQKCNLKKIPREAENWIYKQDLNDLLDAKKIIIDKKYIEYQNADYESVMYFYNNSFKGEISEKKSMYNILSKQATTVFYGDNSETKSSETNQVVGFLTTLINSNINDEIVSFVKYIKPNPAKKIVGTDTDLAKAIYRMTCIELIQDFTQDYANNRYRIVSKRKKEGSYYQGLERFLLRYYSKDRAKEEIKNVYNINVTSKSRLEKEIFQCLSYLTTFVYDKISVKRKRAIDDMRTFCITGANDEKDWKETNEELKDFIYYYFNSKYAKSDYIADNGEEYSLTKDTNGGKISSEKLLFKYLKVIDEKVEYGTPIDNLKHLQGAVRIIRRSLTDSNPTLSLLNSFCIFFLGTNNNENLKKEVIESYKEGMLDFAEREKDLIHFWELFKKYNEILTPFSDTKLSELKEEITLKIHRNKFKKIASKYID